MKMFTYSKLNELDAARRNRSNKPLARLKASMAQVEYDALLANAPGSVRRALARGHNPFQVNPLPERSEV